MNFLANPIYKCECMCVLSCEVRCILDNVSAKKVWETQASLPCDTLTVPPPSLSTKSSLQLQRPAPTTGPKGEVRLCSVFILKCQEG